MSVIICTYNGAGGISETLDCLNLQTIRRSLEIIVVDDGSNPRIDEMSVVTRGAIYIRHEVNRGLSAARNTGITAAHAPIIAFTDDDCRPTPKWAEELLSVYADPIVGGAGGPILGLNKVGLLSRYYHENEPLRHLEADLSQSNSLPYRFWIYALSNLRKSEREGIRDAYSLVGANFSFRLSVLEGLGGFDSGIRFGGDDEDLCHRFRKKYSDLTLRIVPTAIVHHDYNLRILDLARRARAYGVGNARNYLKHKNLSPTFYPSPVLFAFLIVRVLAKRKFVLATALSPLLMAPRWVSSAFRSRSLEPIAYAYLQLMQETAHNIGFISGLWRFRSSIFSQNYRGNEK